LPRAASQFHLRADSDLARAVDRLAADLQMSRNQALVLLLRLGIQVGVEAGLTASALSAAAARVGAHVTGEDGR